MKPICKACIRNRLLCIWGEKASEAGVSLAAGFPNASARPSNVDHDDETPNVDFHPLSTPRPPSTTNIMLFLEEATTDAGIKANNLTQHVVISGVQHGWSKLHHQQARTIAYIDHQLSTRGHGRAARLAFNWLFCMMQGVRSLALVLIIT